MVLVWNGEWNYERAAFVIPLPPDKLEQCHFPKGMPMARPKRRAKRSVAGRKLFPFVITH